MKKQSIFVPDNVKSPLQYSNPFCFHKNVPEIRNCRDRGTVNDKIMLGISDLLYLFTKKYTGLTIQFLIYNQYSYLFYKETFDP